MLALQISSLQINEKDDTPKSEAKSEAKAEAKAEANGENETWLHLVNSIFFNYSAMLFDVREFHSKCLCSICLLLTRGNHSSRWRKNRRG